MTMAVRAFRTFHPDRHPNVINCADYYNEAQFAKTPMGKSGENFGVGCREVITFTRRRVVTFIGRDSWSRPVYQDGDGKLYVDVDPIKDHQPDICTKLGNNFDGEPCDPVNEELEFIPCRDTWQ